MAAIVMLALSCPIKGESGMKQIDSGKRNIESESVYFNTNKEFLQFISGKHILGFHAEGLRITAGTQMLDVRFQESNPVNPVMVEAKEDELRGNVLFEKVFYPNLWDGVDAEYIKTGSGIFKSTFYIQPSEKKQNPVDQIRFKYDLPVSINTQGELIFSCENGRLRESKPIAWQMIHGEKVFIKAAYKKISDREIGFEVEEYNRDFELIIDPVLHWNSIWSYGNWWNEYGHGIAVEENGNIYVTGEDYPNALAVKLNSNGDRVWEVILTPSGTNSCGRGIDVDNNGHVYVTGESDGAWGSPVRDFSGEDDAFVAKLDTSGNIQWHTFLGGIGWDYCTGIAVDSSGNVYVTGYSGSTWGSPLRDHSGWYYDGFVAKLNNSGILQWHMFLGGTSHDYGYSITVDNSGNIFVAGESGSTWGTPLNAHSGSEDGFVAKVSAGGFLEWNTFLGGNSFDTCDGIAADDSGNIYITGASDGSWGNPLRAYTEDYDAFAAKLSGSGIFLWNTFLGGSSADVGNGIALGGSGHVLVTGSSSSSWGNPLSAYRGWADAFVAMITSSGRLEWNLFLGDDESNYAIDIAVGSRGYVYVTGIWINWFFYGLPSEESNIFVAALRPYWITGTVTESGTGISGVTITGLPTEPATSGDGSYQDEMTYGWSGTAAPVLAGYKFTPPDRNYININSDQTGQNYEAYYPDLQISGTVKSNGSGLSGVRMDGLPSQPITQSDGTYSTAVGYGWSGTAVPALTGYMFSPSHIDYSQVKSDQTGQDYTGELNTFSIAGTVVTGRDGLSGVTISGLPGSPVTAGDGTYRSCVDYGWSGIVVPVLTGYIFTPSRMYYKQVKADQTQQDYRAELKTYTLSGHVSSGESGLAEVAMAGLPGSPVTAGNGNYSDRVDHGWSGTVVPALTGYTFTPTQMDYSDVTADRPNQDYTASLIELTMSGTVRENNTGLSGVRLQGLPASPVTKGSGAYSSTVTYGWAGAVTPALSGYEFKPESRNYSNVTADKTHQDYTALRIIYAPAGASAGQVVNRSLFQAEYINVLTWTPNPENQDAEISHYRIYQINGNQLILLAELDGQTFEYRHRDVNPDASYRYALVAVTASGREGRPAYLAIQ